MSLAALRENRAGKVAEMRALVDKASTEKRDLNQDEDTRFKALKNDIAGLDRQIERATALAEAERSAPAIIVHRGDGRFEERARDFSIVRAIRAAIGDDVDAGFEREISREVRTRSGREFAGIAVPDEALATATPQREQRVMLVSDGTTAPLVPSAHLAGRFIDAIRPNLIVSRLGATVIDGLIGDADIPRQTQSVSTQWLAEDEPLNPSDLDFDDLALRPKTVGALTSYSRRTLINSVPDIEMIVRNDLVKQIAAAVDKAALMGTGAGNEPRGVASSAGVFVVDTTAAGPTWGDVLLMVANVETANAAVGGSLAWATNGWVARKLRSSLKVTGDGGSGFLLDHEGKLAGYPVAVSGQLPGGPEGAAPPPGYLLFGNWADVIVASWTGIDLLVNPFETNAYARGRVLVRAMRDMDVGVRRAASFSVATDVAVSVAA